jgi:hypothetical protein
MAAIFALLLAGNHKMRDIHSRSHKNLAIKETFVRRNRRMTDKRTRRTYGHASTIKSTLLLKLEKRDKTKTVYKLHREN